MTLVPEEFMAYPSEEGKRETKLGLLMVLSSEELN